MNNDLISREALIQHAYSAVVDGVEKDIIDLSDVDNAPTVEPDKVLVANVTFDEDKLKDIVQTEVIEKIKSGELVIKDERPQGEWIADYTEKKHKKVFACDKCRRLSIQGKTNFCPNCGAKMQKGGAE